MNVNLFIAFAAGIVSFLSPCVFPVIPSYLTFIGGVSLTEVEENRKSRKVLFFNSLLFVIGFTMVFTLLGIFFSGVGMALSGASTYINIVAGTIVIILGVNFIFDFWKLLNLEKRFHFSRRPGGTLGSVLLGMAFGAGWTPCIGPILASILFLASGSGSVGRGAVLLTAYSIGLGLPFIAAGLFIARFRRLFTRLGKHLQTIKIFSGVFLIAIGGLIISGRLNRINIFLFRLASQLEYAQELNPLPVVLISGGVMLIPALLLGISILRFYLRKRDFSGTEPADELPAPSEAVPGNPMGRIIFLLLFLLVSVAIFAGWLDVARLLVGWLTFQGL